MSSSGPTNRLAKESSPYLLQHAHNPVDWYPWGEEAFARARAEDKPVLLSVGYSACHWCHVMAHESFEDPKVAAQLNADFVCVKVDREERPDVDQVYQGVVQLLGRGGGWPLTVFLTPDKRPFFGGTYFPPADRYGMPGFPRLLSALAGSWRTQRDDVLAQAQEFEGGLKVLAAHGLDGAAGALAGSDVRDAAEQLGRAVDPRHGGFGSTGPKFPNPMNLELMLRGHLRGGSAALREGALLTLEKMARGGLYDQLGGGFHRYSVDESWSVPHFEKMLYDNAQLLHLYSEAWQVEPRPLWKKVVEETAAWLAREMTAPEGGFHAAQDADSEGEEGRFFVWTPEQLEQVLGADDAKLLGAHFDVRKVGNFEAGTTVLAVAREAAELAASLSLPVEAVEQRLAAARAKLLAERSRRIVPSRDDKVLAGWNGLTVRGLAFAGRVFSRADWVAMARRAADHLLAHFLRPDGRLLRSGIGGQVRFDGVLEDYGGVAAGLCALYQATFESRYLEAAVALADTAQARFFDAERGAYFAAAKGTADLVVSPFALHDNAVPSGASMLVEAQVALAALTGDPRFLEQATLYVERLAGDLKRNPFAYGHLWLAADAALEGAAEVTLVGAPTATAKFLEALNARYLPRLSVRCFASLEGAPGWARGSLEGRKALGAPATAWACEHFRCHPPVATPEALLAQLGG